MNQVAAIFDTITVYWYSVILLLAVIAGICFFFACCTHSGIRQIDAAVIVLAAAALSLFLSRAIYWYCRPFSFADFGQAMTTPASGSHALLGAFAGCLLAAAFLHRIVGSLLKLLDCMAVAGCGAIALGRFAFFFADGDRGQILAEITSLPWAYPVINAGSGLPEYRLATFLFQGAFALVLFGVLVYLFFAPGLRERGEEGSIALLFALFYSASQVIMDSTRYDSLYLRSNGFVSLVQILSAVALAFCVGMASYRLIRKQGICRKLIAAWVLTLAMFGGAGYMEYYVQRHGKLAATGYSIMAACLIGIVTIGTILWSRTALPALPKAAAQEEAKQDTVSEEL